MNIDTFEKAEMILKEIKNLSDVKNLNPQHFIIKERDVRFSQSVLNKFKKAIEEEIEQLQKKFEEL